MTCTACQTTLPEGARFCSNCGRTAIAASAPVAPAAPARFPRADLETAVATRQELGERMEPEVLDAFLARVEQRIDAHIDARVDERLRAGGLPSRESRHGETGPSLALAIVSLRTGIPLTAIGGSAAGLVGVIAVWAGIGAVNVAFNRWRSG